MSHWQTSKLNLACSLNVLKKALISIMPEWERHIKEDENSNLEAKNYYGHGTKGGYKVVITLSSGDIGFKQNEDNTWTADYDHMSLPNAMRRVGGVEGALKTEIAAMKAKAIAETRGYQLLSDDTEGDTRVVRVLIPVNEFPA